MKLDRKNKIITAVTSIGLFLSVSCSDGSFSGNSDGKQSNSGEQTPAVEGEVVPVISEEAGTASEAFSLNDAKSIVDVVFIIDTSDSMKDELTKVAQSMKEFVRKFASDARTSEFQLFVLAGKSHHQFNAPAELSSDPRFALETNSPVGNYNELAIAKGFLEGSIKVQKISLRPQSYRHLIFVSDDNASAKGGGISEDSFRTFLNSRPLEKIAVHGIVCQISWGNCEAKGTAYTNLANDAKYKGTIHDLNETNWDPIFSSLFSDISAKDNFKSFKLKGMPLSSNPGISVVVDGVDLPASAFSYSTSSQTVTVNQVLKSTDVVKVIYKTK